MSRITNIYQCIQNRFHVKSDWKKIFQISTMCRRKCLTPTYMIYRLYDVTFFINHLFFAHTNLTMEGYYSTKYCNHTIEDEIGVYFKY